MQSTTVKNVSIHREDIEGYTTIGNQSTNRTFEPLINKYDPFLIVSQSKNLVIMQVVAKKNEYASPEPYIGVVKQIPDNKQSLPHATRKVNQQFNKWGYIIPNTTSTNSVLTTYPPENPRENNISNTLISKINQALTNRRVILGVNNARIATLLTHRLCTTHSVFITTDYNNIPLPKCRLIISIDIKHDGITKLN